MCSEEKESKIANDLSNIHKTLYCLRHAQSEYNETVRNPKTWLKSDFWYNWFDPKIRDPLLSKHGNKQINKMSKQLDKCSFLSSFGVELIVTSPLQRAINTMFGVLQNQSNIINKDKISIIAHHELREWVDTFGDIGTPKTKLIQKYNNNNNNNNNVDFSFIDNEIWWNQDIKSDESVIKKETTKNVNDRISSFKHWILKRPENNILIVGHSRWFRQFVGAMFKLNNCAMMKVELHGMKVKSWEYIDFDKIEQNQNKIQTIIKQSAKQQSI